MFKNNPNTERFRDNRHHRVMGTILTAVSFVLLFAGCGGGENKPKKTRGPAPTTTLTLLAIDPGTLVSRTRFGAPSATATLGAGVELEITSANRFHDLLYNYAPVGSTPDCSTSPLTYDEENKPQLVPTDTATQQKWNVCWFGTFRGAGETPNTAVVIYDLTPPVPQLWEAGIEITNPLQTIYTSYPSFQTAFDSTPETPLEEDGRVVYTTDGNNPVYNSSTRVVTYGTATTVTYGIGQFIPVPLDKYVYRTIKVMGIDAVGNASAVTTYTIPLDVVDTLPLAGSFNTNTDVTLNPDAANLAAWGSQAWIAICRYRDFAGYECADPASLPDAPNFTVTPATERNVDVGTDYNLQLLFSDPTQYPVFLPIIAGETVVYDFKYVYQPDSLTFEVLDKEHQSLLILDNDEPDVLVYKDRATSTTDALVLKTLVFDPGYYTVRQAEITNYDLWRDTLNECATYSACLNISSVPEPVLNPVTRLSTNTSVQVPITATDAAGNVGDFSHYWPVGRELLDGVKADPTDEMAKSLGGALAKGDFDADGVPDIVVGEASTDQVYIFLGGLRTSMAHAGTADLSAGLDITAVGSTVTVDLYVNKVTTAGLTMELNGTYPYLTTPTAVTVDQLARAFNLEMLRLRDARIGDGVDIGVYLTAEDSNEDGMKDQLVLRSHLGQVNHCVTLSGALATAMGFAASPLCVYDYKLTGNASSNFGASLAVGEFDGANGDDIAVGAPKDTGAAAGSGAAYAYFSAGAAPFFTNTPSVTFKGALADDDFGWAMGAGRLDLVNHFTKTTDDLVIGAPGYMTTTAVEGYTGDTPDAGAIYLFQTNASWTPGAVFTADAATNGDTQKIVSDRNPGLVKQRFGHSILVTLLDNSPGTDSLVVGAPGAEFFTDTAPPDPVYGGTAYAGNVYVYIMWPNVSTPINPSPNSLIYPPNNVEVPDSKFGWAIGEARSLFGLRGGYTFCSDDIPCLAIGAPHGDNSSKVGEINHGIVYIGPRNKFPSDMLTYYGTNKSDLLGTAFAYGDLNGDGRGDLVVGQGGGLKDGVYPAGYGGISIIAGAELAPSLTTFTKQFPALDVETVGGNKRNSRFGWALMVLDGDPADEFDQMDTLIIGAPGYKYGLIQERGRVHIMEAGSFNNF